MDVLGSKRFLSDVVVIHGHHPNVYAWRNAEDDYIYPTSGLIVECCGNRYVVTTRSKIIDCDDIIMFHNYFNKEATITKQKLHILFQSIEYDLVVLGTRCMMKLDFGASKLINGKYIPDKKFGYNIMENDLFIVPTRKSKYRIIKMKMDQKNRHYKVDICNAKFVGSIIYNEKYTPDDYIYMFEVPDMNKLNGFCGSIVTNSKNKLVGLVLGVKEKRLYVKPTKTIRKALSDFVKFLDRQDKYCGIVDLPFRFGIAKKSEVRIIDVGEKNGMQVKPGDLVHSIDGKPIFVRKGNIFIFDEVYKFNLPLDVYLHQNFDQECEIKVGIMRGDRNFRVTTKGVPHQSTSVPLTFRPYYFPKPGISHIIISGLVIVELTHELIHIMLSNNIEITNSLIKKFFSNKLEDFGNYLLIIDCLDENLIKKYGFPKFDPNLNGQLINCPQILSINKKKVGTIREASNVLLKSNSLLVEMDGRKLQIDL
ncbi:MAG: hypothetical protein QW303_01485 [Nitrososphaerota archaeon]